MANMKCFNVLLLFVSAAVYAQSTTIVDTEVTTTDCPETSAAAATTSAPEITIVDTMTSTVCPVCESMSEESLIATSTSISWPVSAQAAAPTLTVTQTLEQTSSTLSWEEPECSEEAETSTWTQSAAEVTAAANVTYPAIVNPATTVPLYNTTFHVASPTQPSNTIAPAATSQTFTGSGSRNNVAFLGWTAGITMMSFWLWV